MQPVNTHTLTDSALSPLHQAWPKLTTTTTNYICIELKFKPTTREAGRKAEKQKNRKAEAQETEAQKPELRKRQQQEILGPPTSR